MEMVDGTMIDTSDKQLSPDAVLYAYPGTVATEKPPLGAADEARTREHACNAERERWQEWAEAAEAELLTAYDDLEEQGRETARAEAWSDMVGDALINCEEYAEAAEVEVLELREHLRDTTEQLDALTAAYVDVTAHYEELLGTAALKGELDQARRTNLADYVVCSRDGGTEVWLCWQAPSGRWWRRRPDRTDWHVCSSPIGRRGWSTWRRAAGALDDIVKEIGEGISERYQEMAWRQVAAGPGYRAPIQGDPGDEQPTNTERTNGVTIQ